MKVIQLLIIISAVILLVIGCDSGRYNGNLTIVWMDGDTVIYKNATAYSNDGERCWYNYCRSDGVPIAFRPQSTRMYKFIPASKVQ